MIQITRIQVKKLQRSSKKKYFFFTIIILKILSYSSDDMIKEK